MSSATRARSWITTTVWSSTTPLSAATLLKLRGWPPAVGRVIGRTGRRPRTVTADRDYGEASIEHDRGVRTVVIPRQGRPGNARQVHERRRVYRRTVKWRTGSEARISTLNGNTGGTAHASITSKEPRSGPTRGPGPQPGQDSTWPTIRGAAEKSCTDLQRIPDRSMITRGRETRRPGRQSNIRAPQEPCFGDGQARPCNREELVVASTQSVAQWIAWRSECA